MTSRAAYVLAGAVFLLAVAVAYHACLTRKSVTTGQQLHHVLREIQQAGFGEEAP